MRKILSALIILFLTLVMTPTRAADAPTGCPSTWGLKFENGVESTGKLDFAIKSYGISKIYKKMDSYATVGDIKINNINTLASISNGDRIWLALALARENRKPIIFHDTWLIRFENCPDFTSTADRLPVEVSILPSLDIESAIEKWAINTSSATGNYPVPLELKDLYKTRFNSWLSSLKLAKNVPPCEARAVCNPPAMSFFFNARPISYGYGFMIFPKIGSGCVSGLNGEELFVNFGCTYEVVIPNGNHIKSPTSGGTISFQSIEEIDFPLPAASATPTPKVSTSTPGKASNNKKITTIRCQKNKTIKKVMGYNPICPKGYVKL
jgi:hypothetical protein